MIEFYFTTILVEALIHGIKILHLPRKSYAIYTRVFYNFSLCTYLTFTRYVFILYYSLTVSTVEAIIPVKSVEFSIIYGFH